MTEVKKDRNISIFDFLDQLQREYVVSELRSKIYRKKKDKDYWRRVMEGKRKSIQKIASNNNLPSILTDDILKENYRVTIYRITGYPDFIYRDDSQKQELESKDFYSYYCKEKEFRYHQKSSVEVGILISVNRRNETLFLQDIKTKEKITISLQDCSRIL